MFTDDTKLFLTNKDINKLFNDANVEIQKILIWFKANKLSLNLIKKKLTLFLSLKKTGRYFEIGRENVTQFLAIYIENFT